MAAIKEEETDAHTGIDELKREWELDSVEEVAETVVFCEFVAEFVFCK